MRRILCVAALALVGCDDDGSSGTVTLTVGPSQPAFVAAHDGDGAWTVVTASGNGTYRFPAHGATYGVAVVCDRSGYQDMSILELTVAETATPGLDCTIVGDATATLAGTIAGSSGILASVDAGYDGSGQTGQGVVPYSFMARPGTWDVFAQRGQPNQIDRMIRKNAVTLTAGTTTTIDFDFATEGFALEPHAVTLEGVVQGDFPQVNALLFNKRGNTVLELSEGGNVYRAVPVSELGDDINLISVSAPRTDDVTRAVQRWSIATQDFTATLPPLPLTPLVEPETTTPYVRMRAAIPGDVEMDRYDIVYGQFQANDALLVWNARLSKGYREITAAESYTLPDLSSLAGFDPSWGLVEGDLNYRTTAMSTTASIDQLFRANLTAAELDGRTDTTSERSGQYTP